MYLNIFHGKGLEVHEPRDRCKNAEGWHDVMKLTSNVRLALRLY